MIRIDRITAVALLALAAAPAAAQTPVYTPKAVGTAGAFLADARGQEALFLNPANLGMSKTPYYSVSVPNLGLGVRFTGTSLGQVGDLLDYDDLPQGRKDEILAGVPGSGLEAGLDIRVPLAAVSVGRVAVGVAYAATYRATLGRDVVDLALNGYQAGRTDYAVDNTGGSHASFYDVAAAYGRKIGPVSVGVTAHWLHGRTLARHRLFEPTFDLEAEDLRAELREVHVDGGSGYALDFGIAAEPTERLAVSVAVSNAVSSFRWSEELRTRHLVLTRASFENGDGEALYEDLKGSNEPVDANAVPVTVYETARGLYDGAWFPATLRAGVAYALPGERTRVSGALHAALDDGRLPEGWRRQLAVGAEHRVSRLFQARGGLASDLGAGWIASAGASLGPVHVGVARTSDTLGGARGSGWMATFGLAMRTSVSRGDYDHYWDHLKQPQPAAPAPAPER